MNTNKDQEVKSRDFSQYAYRMFRAKLLKHLIDSDLSKEIKIECILDALACEEV